MPAAATRGGSKERGLGLPPGDAWLVTREASNAALEAHSLPIVIGNEWELLVVFQNLISNAIKYRDQPLRIRFAAHRYGNEWQF